VEEIANGRPNYRGEVLIDEFVTGARPTAERPDRMVLCFGEPALSTRGRIVRVTGNAGRLLAGLVARPPGATLDQLIEVVWPGDPPKSARSALHVHLSRLRRELQAVVDGPTVEREGATYRLDLNGWTVDVDLFRELRRKAATAPASTVAGLLADALRLAHSPAFVVDGESVASSATYQLVAARLDVEEEFVDALLDIGRHADAERAAIELVDAEPFRERRWALLMRAEAMLGRRRDALATFQRARRRLVDELGLEPGDDLQQTQRFVLSGDTMALQSADPLPGFEFDREPLSFGMLVGRDESVERVEQALARRLPVVVTGAPGAGKTRLATEIARRRRLQDQEVAWIDLPNMEFRTGWFETEIERWSRRHPGGLVVIDNAESNIEAAVEAVGVVRRVALDVGVIVTCRFPPPIDAVVERLGALGLPDGRSDDAIESANAVRLLRELLASRAPQAMVGSELAADLVERVSGLPLGIRLVADLARSVPPWQMLDRTASTLRSAIEPAFAATLSEVTDTARAVLAALSVVPGRLDSGLIGALAGCDGVDSAVEELCEHGLLQFDDQRPDAPYTLLEPLRDVATGLLDEAARVAVLDRLVGECVRRADAATLLRQDDARPFPIQVQLARELPWHHQAIAHLARTGRSEPALMIATGLELPLYGLGWWTSNTAVQDAALAIPGEASSLRARVHAARGRPGLLHQLDASHLGLAVEIARDVGDAAAEGRALSMLGIKCWWDGAYANALAHFDAALEAASRGRDRFVEWEARRYAGVTMIVSGRLEEGFAAQLEVLESVRATRGADLLVPHVQMYLGHCRRHVGDVDAAVANLEAAREAYERTTNTASLIHIYGALAELATDRGDLDVGLRMAGRGLELSSIGGLRTYEPWLLCTIARVHAHAGDEMAARHSAAAAIASLEQGWVGETHRVAVELASVATLLGDDRSAARLIGLADAVEDRRDLPFVSPAESQRASAVRARVRADGGLAEVLAVGATSTIGEASSRLIAPALAG